MMTFQYSWSHVVPQAVCAIFEKSVKTLLHDFAPMVSQLSEMLGQMYSTIPQASALDLTRQVHTHMCNMCNTHTQTHISILSLILCGYMQRDLRDLLERAVYELISYAPVSPRLMRIQHKFVKLLLQSWLNSQVSVVWPHTTRTHYISFSYVLPMLSLTEIFLHPGDIILTCSNHNLLFKL